MAAEHRSQQQQDEEDLDQRKDILYPAAHFQAHQVDHIKYHDGGGGYPSAKNGGHLAGIEEMADIFRAHDPDNGSGTGIGYKLDTVDGKGQRRMVAERKDLIVGAGDGITGTDLRIGEGAA